MVSSIERVGMPVAGPLYLAGAWDSLICVARSIRSANAIGRGGATMTFADQRAELTPQFREVTFKLPDGGQKSDRLALRAEPSNAVWALEKAWLR